MLQPDLFPDHTEALFYFFLEHSIWVSAGHEGEVEMEQPELWEQYLKLKENNQL